MCDVRCVICDLRCAMCSVVMGDVRCVMRCAVCDVCCVMCALCLRVCVFVCRHGDQRRRRGALRVRSGASTRAPRGCGVPVPAWLACFFWPPVLSGGFGSQCRVRRKPCPRRRRRASLRRGQDALLGKRRSWARCVGVSSDGRRGRLGTLGMRFAGGGGRQGIYGMPDRRTAPSPSFLSRAAGGGAPGLLWGGLALIWAWGARRRQLKPVAPGEATPFAGRRRRARRGSRPAALP